MFDYVKNEMAAVMIFLSTWLYPEYKYEVNWVAEVKLDTVDGRWLTDWLTTAYFYLFFPFSINNGHTVICKRGI